MDPEDAFSVVWDSGASMNISFDKNDFVGEIKRLPNSAQIKGIGTKLRIEGYGHVVWSLLDTNGKLRHLKLPCYYIPDLEQRLLSTSMFSRIYPSNKIIVSNGVWNVSANPQDPSESGIDIFINPNNNLPTSTCIRESGLSYVAAHFTEFVSATHQKNLNLSAPEK